MKRRELLGAIGGTAAIGIELRRFASANGEAKGLRRKIPCWPPLDCLDYDGADQIDEPTPTPTETPTPTADPREPLEVAVYYYKYPKAAEVVATYVEFALEGVWPVKAWVVEEPVPRDVARTDEDENDYACSPELEFIDYINGGDSRSCESYESHKQAADCNILVANTTGAWATQGGAVARVGHADSIVELHGQEPVEKGYSWAHKSINTALHEVGHCFGLDHCDSDRVGGCVPPMADDCNTSNCSYHRFAEDVWEAIREYAA